MKITVNNLKDVYKSKQCTPETMELKGYTWLANLFVDSSGLGAEDEPALTQDRFMDRLKELIKENGGHVYTAITGAGQFQVNLGVYKKTSKSKVKRISGNTYEMLENPEGYTHDFRTIRLYDTDIITLDYLNRKIVLQSGGFETPTTKKWINKYLPARYMLKQQNFEWLVVDSVTGKVIPFTDGMELPIE
jgi:hypothetical protein